MEIKGAIFDLDGTLLDSMWVWNQVDIDFLGKRGYDVPPDYAKTIAAMGFRETAAYTIERFGLQECVEDVIAEWDHMAMKMYHECVQIKPCVKEVLAWMKKQGMHLGIATASYRSLFEPCLRRNGVYDYFEAITETSEVERGKGFPDIYIKAAHKMGCTPQQCLVFEDITKGIEAAGKGGFQTVAVYDPATHEEWEENKRKADYHIVEFMELLEQGSFLNAL
ncbi:MAG: HAD family hydrolase [Eubacterium sp.]